jgi:hypothetical protein
MNIERRAFALDDIKIEERGDGKTPVIRGHAAVFDKLSENLGGFREKIAPGAFSDVLDDDVRALFNHDSNHILGRTASGTLKITQDKTGLRYEIDPPDTQTARDLLVSMKRGDINQSSFGFTVESDDWVEDDEGRVVRTITKVKRLYDVSPVTYPAYPDATVGLRGLDAFQKVQDEKKTTPIELLKKKLDLEQLR